MGLVEKSRRGAPSSVYAEHVNAGLPVHKAPVGECGFLSLCPAAMSNPVPLRAFVGGVGIALASHNLLLLNGSVFGVSGFIHRCCHGASEPIFSVGGLILSGVAVGALRSTVPPSVLPNVDSLPIVAISGFLAGLGTKVGLT